MRTNPLVNLIMKLATKLTLMLACFMTVFFVPQMLGQDASSPSLLRVMSFNIRLGVAKDGDNHWEKRRELVATTIKNFSPDILGTQETWDFQAGYLAEKLEGYQYFGRSRQLDGSEGEQCGVFYREERFEKIAAGHFWLSETPNRPGSKSWDSSLPRMATWLRLWDRTAEESLLVINTHFDHRGKQARLESAKVIRNFIEQQGADESCSNIVVTGDFNASENSPPYQALFGSSEDETDNNHNVIDSLRAFTPSPTEDEGTFNGFSGKSSGGRIDWIGASSSLQVNSATIDRTNEEGRYPSDHFPVTAILEYK
jgi:endonuclease/exonuclease/phosphatase family metal-dependent hydrolase